MRIAMRHLSPLHSFPSRVPVIVSSRAASHDRRGHSHNNVDHEPHRERQGIKRRKTFLHLLLLLRLSSLLRTLLTFRLPCLASHTAFASGPSPRPDHGHCLRLHYRQKVGEERAESNRPPRRESMREQKEFQAASQANHRHMPMFQSLSHTHTHLAHPRIRRAGRS